MTSYFRRTFTRHKFIIFYGIHTQKFFSSFTYSNCSNLHRFNNKIHPRRLIEPPKQVQCRNYSSNELQSTYAKFFNDVTTSQASKWLNNFIIDTHDVTGFSWWGTIMLATAVLKLTISLPCGVYQQYLISKIKLTKIEFNDIANEIKNEVLLEAKRGKWTNQKAKLHLFTKHRQEWNKLVVKNNCHPFKSVILSLGQLPGWLLFSLTLRKFSSDVSSGTSDSLLAALQFQVGGPLWCQNLTLPDHTLILPSIITLATITTIELNLFLGNNLSFLSKIVTNLMRVLTLAGFFISSAVPSCISLFWATSAVLGLLQNLFLMSPRVRRLFRIPKTPTDLVHPYSQFAYELGKKCSRFGKLKDLFSKK